MKRGRYIVKRRSVTALQYRYFCVILRVIDVQVTVHRDKSL